MPFSLGSYLLGVGTVVGALAFGFGGGVVLTHTALKETPAGPTRVERVARAEPEPSASPQASGTQATAQASAPDQAAVATRQATTPDQAHPASVAAVKQDAPPLNSLRPFVPIRFPPLKPRRGKRMPRGTHYRTLPGKQRRPSNRSRRSRHQTSRSRRSKSSQPNERNQSRRNREKRQTARPNAQSAMPTAGSGRTLHPG
jgi:hypothetical protein